MSESEKIPFLDLVAPHLELKDELMAVFESALAAASFIGGPVVETFERDFAAFCETKYCIGVGSGTDALRFALIAAGVREGDMVVTVPNTFIATTEAITQAGARPAFVDIDGRTYNMDPEKLREFLEVLCARGNAGMVHRQTGRRVSAVVPVHLYGQPADMDPILELGRRYNLIVLEDSCQAHGAEYFSRNEQRWLKAGSMGTAAAFSFYPGKNLGACGEGGAVTTNDPELANKVRMLRDHGQAKKYFHDMEGYNGRLDAIQAGILQVKLKYVAGWNVLRRAAAATYREAFASAGAPDLAAYEPDWAKAAYHLYVVRVADRCEAQQRLTEQAVGTGIHYPIPLHLQRAYTNLGYKLGDFPVAEMAASEILSLPMFPGIQTAQLTRVAAAVLSCRGAVTERVLSAAAR